MAAASVPPPGGGHSPWQVLLDHLQSSRAQNLIQRIDELRALLVRWALLMFVLIGFGFYFGKEIINFLKVPLADALPPHANVLHFTGPMEVMMAYMKVSFLLAIVGATPFALFQAWRFVGPALPIAQRGYVLPFFISSLSLFVLGVLFCYYVMLPIGLKWLIGFGGDQASAVITVGEYIDMLTFMLVGFGGAFQLPLVIILLERLGIISEAKLKKNRGVILIAILVIAALLAPSPDPVSQLSLAAPMYLMFEAALLVIRWLKRRESSGSKSLVS